uniref:ATP synthase complex subunit 8 n=1 Tax=Rotunda rotundapex TaxID=2528347 RepID=A0A650G8Y3_9NEOP|nr:ATP synthase F0 subunit 8 [Rotunda rotundapex]QGW14832.1 ATP synthase F0 subunit 8 [Rotunda rotundapex]WAR64271.1 ATP synthase F0 subunit 8 [Rotunda rotundapex]
MPQMMPINWIFLFFIFIYIFLIFNIMNYYIFKKKLLLNNKLMKKNFLSYWKW